MAEQTAPGALSTQQTGPEEWLDSADAAPPVSLLERVKMERYAANIEAHMRRYPCHISKF